METRRNVHVAGQGPAQDVQGARRRQDLVDYFINDSRIPETVVLLLLLPFENVSNKCLEGQPIGEGGCV